MLRHELPPGYQRSEPPVAEQQFLAEVLVRLGQTRQSNNLNQIAKHLNQGTSIVDPELEEDLNRAVAEVAWIRAAIMEALGVKQ